MFVKKYQFQIKSNDSEKYLGINKLAEKIYKKSGLIKTEVNLTKTGNLTDIELLEYYESRDLFEKTLEKVNKDKEIKRLWKEFMKLVVDKKITDDSFETIEMEQDL